MINSIWWLMWKLNGLYEKKFTFKSDHTAFASLDTYRLVDGLVALKLGTGRAFRSDEALFASQHQHRPIHQVKVVLGSVGVIAIQRVGIRVEVTGSLGRQELAVVCAQRDRTVIWLPCQIEECIRRALVIGCLDTTAGFQAPVTILHRSYVPSFRHPIKLQLECLMARDFVLIGRHVDA